METLQVCGQHVHCFVPVFEVEFELADLSVESIGFILVLFCFVISGDQPGVLLFSLPAHAEFFHLLVEQLIVRLEPCVLLCQDCVLLGRIFKLSLEALCVSLAVMETLLQVGCLSQSSLRVTCLLFEFLLKFPGLRVELGFKDPLEGCALFDNQFPVVRVHHE